VLVINSNVCPACGNEIVTQPVREFMNELKEALAKMPNDPEGLAGWLLSNYRMEKIGSGEPTEFYRGKPKFSSKEEEFLRKKAKGHPAIPGSMSMYQEAFDQQSSDGGVDIDEGGAEEIEERVTVKAAKEMRDGVLKPNEIPQKIKAKIKESKAKREQEEEIDCPIPLAPSELQKMVERINSIEPTLPEPLINPKQRQFGKR
jgi:hypothetical protein